MKTSVFLFVVAAFFVVAFAQEDDDDESPDVDKAYMIKYVKLLMDNGYVKEEDVESKNILELIDMAINGNEVAMEKEPWRKPAREASIEYLKEQKEKMSPGSEPQSESQPESESPTPANKEEKNFFVKGIQKLMNLFKGIF